MPPGAIYLGDHIVPKLETLIFAVPPQPPVLAGEFHPDPGNQFIQIVENWEAEEIIDIGNDSPSISVGSTSVIVLLPNIYDDLVAFWNLNEQSGDRLDSIGNNDLTPNNAVGFTTGRINDAADFNGTNQWLSVTDDSAATDLNLTSTFTLTMWIKIDTLVNGATPINKGQLIFTPANFEYAWEFFQAAPLAPINLQFITNITVDTDLNVGVLTTGVWHFVVAWADNLDGGGVDNSPATFLHIQLDNGAIITGTFGNPTGTPFATPTTYDLNFGSSGSGGAFLDGAMDAVGLWHRGITEDERTYLWNDGDGREFPFE